jgi:hypothetical protein
MTEHTDPAQRKDALDELVTELLECGAVLSQMISGMVQWEAAGLSAPDAAPIPETAHTLVRGVLGDVRRRHSRRDVRVAAAIVKESTAAICENIFFIPVEEAESWGTRRNGDGMDDPD